MSKSGCHWVRVDRRIRFEYATWEPKNFGIQKEKVADSKISGYVRTGQNIYMLFTGREVRMGKKLCPRS